MQKGGVPNAPAVVKPSDTSSGFTWFFDAATALKVRAQRQREKDAAASASEEPSPTQDGAEGELNALILKNPQLPAAALVNTMKTHGLTVVKVTAAFRRHVRRIREARTPSPLESVIGSLLGQKLPKAKREADSSSANAQVMRTKESTKFRFSATNLRESGTANDGIGPTRFKCVLLMEGLGNYNDAYYYDKPALESAVPLFTGAKIFADHPSTLEEETRPERSVRDVLGAFDNVQVEESEDGRATLTGEVNILPDQPFAWARALMREAIEHSKKFPDKDLVGLSINAAGASLEVPIDEVLSRAPSGAKPKLVEAKNQGIESVKVVSKLSDAISCDLVTEAGAGGKILTAIQGE